MKRISLALSVAASAALFSLSPAALAADGSVCYSSTFTYTIGASSSVTYPQITNATTYYCTGLIPVSTIQQLSQAGWIIVSIEEVPYSQTVNNDGSSTSKVRTRLVIQK